MNSDDVRRLKECYSTSFAIIRSNHAESVEYSSQSQAIFSISASILACKLFDTDVGHPGGDKPSRAALLDL